MRYSVTMVATDLSMRLVDLARAVEERGLDGLWLPDHTHIPTSRVSPYPLGGHLPDRYMRNVDQIVGLSMAAAVTSRIRLGAGIMLAGLRDPIVTAKSLATLDQQSGGRLAVGVGYGWNREELADHGVDPTTRRDRTREHVLAMRQLWEQDVASFGGDYVAFDECWAWPKPVQLPLPVLVGGSPSPTVFAHVAEYGQGWIPLGGAGLSGHLRVLRERLAVAGRDLADLEVVPFVAPELSHTKVDALESAGATEVAFEVPLADSAAVHPMLDRIAAFVSDRRRRGSSRSVVVP